MGDLREMAHAQQAAGLQIHGDGVALAGFGADQHTAWVAERYQGDGMRFKLVFLR